VDIYYVVDTYATGHWEVTSDFQNESFSPAVFYVICTKSDKSTLKTNDLKTDKLLKMVWFSR